MLFGPAVGVDELGHGRLDASRGLVLRDRQCAPNPDKIVCSAAQP
jgi:hypothetical protein